MTDPALVNLDAECDLLGHMMHDAGLVDRVADIIDPADLAEPLHERIYAAIVREISLGKKASPVTLKSYFETDQAMEQAGGTSYLLRLFTDYAVCDPIATARLLRDLSQRRAMQAGLSTAAMACGDLAVTPSEILDHAEAALAGHAKDAVHQPSGAECFEELLAGWREKVPGVTCGVIPSLDGLLGPLKPKQLVIGAGRPGMGKTALALSYAIGAAMNGHGVLFVSLEMSSTELAARMAADMCFDGERGIPFSAIRDGTLGEGQYRKVTEAGVRMSRLPFQVIDAGSLTTGRLAMLVRRHARRMKAKGHKLELVIIDYLQLLSPDSKGRSNYEAVSEVSRSLKALAKDNGLAVFALAQLSREVEKRPDKRPQLSDLRDSGQIEQDADAVLFLLRQEYYLRQEEPDQLDPKRADWQHALAKFQGQIEFILAKRRNGVTGNAPGEFHGGYQAVRG